MKQSVSNRSGAIKVASVRPALGCHARTTQGKAFAQPPSGLTTPRWDRSQKRCPAAADKAPPASRAITAFAPARFSAVSVFVPVLSEEFIEEFRFVRPPMLAPCSCAQTWTVLREFVLPGWACLQGDRLDAGIIASALAFAHHLQ